MIPLDTSKSARSIKVIIGQREQFAEPIEKITDFSPNDTLVVTNSADMFASCEAVSFKQAKDLLGQEKKQVIFDLFDEIAVDALAAIAGIIPGAGSLILCMPDRQQWAAVYSSYFSQRFIHYLEQNKSVEFIDCTDNVRLNDIADVMTNALPREHVQADIQLTADQLEVVEKIQDLSDSDQPQSLVIISDRGRGKSSSLGMAAASLLQTKKIKIIITAPRFKACEMAFHHAKKILSAGKIKQACLRYQHSELRFMAPDELLQNNTAADILFIDEAAAIPLPMLKRLLQRYDKSVFASTVHGYEGTGRGFSVRFMAHLDKQQWHWQKIEMKTPVRWAAGDALEAWLFKVFCLDVELQVLAPDIDGSKITIEQFNQQQLSENESLLRQVFALLVLAHYRTRPSDLQRLLDDDMTITLAQYDNCVIAVLLSADEGGFEQSMSDAIYQGHRRARGHLLAQTLCYHCGVKEAATALSHRIIRIVVHPDYQSHGMGSQLVQYLLTELKSSNVDMLGTSFGLTRQLARFWQLNGFELVRIGLKHEKSSGERAGVFVHALTQQGAAILEKAKQRFAAHLPLLSETVLADVDACFKPASSEQSEEQSRDSLTAIEREDVDSFIQYARAYELCIGGVSRWLIMNSEQLKSYKDQKVYYSVVDNIVFRHQGWQATTQTMGLAGKKQTQALFKEAVSWYWKQINS